jgi:hypothetical protein
MTKWDKTQYVKLHQRAKQSLLICAIESWWRLSGGRCNGSSDVLVSLSQHGHKTQPLQIAVAHSTKATSHWF